MERNTLRTSRPAVAVTTGARGNARTAASFLSARVRTPADDQAAMSDVLFPIVVGVVLLALAVDLLALIEWGCQRARRRRE